MKKLALTLTVGLAIAISGCTTQTTTSADCVNVIVDFQSLKNEKKSECVKVEGEIDAMTAFNAAGYAIYGTDKYGLQIICRVNGLPDAVTPIVTKDQDTYLEKCADMPPEFAYWALLIRTPEKDWQYAPVGIADLTVKPGEQLALVFSVDEKMVLPN
jgi:hypothetical protein